MTKHQLQQTTTSDTTGRHRFEQNDTSWKTFTGVQQHNYTNYLQLCKWTLSQRAEEINPLNYQLKFDIYKSVMGWKSRHTPKGSFMRLRYVINLGDGPKTLLSVVIDFYVNLILRPSSGLSPILINPYLLLVLTRTVYIGCDDAFDNDFRALVLYELIFKVRSVLFPTA